MEGDNLIKSYRELKNYDEMTLEEKEEYLNKNGLSSETEFYMMRDIVS